MTEATANASERVFAEDGEEKSELVDVELAPELVEVDTVEDTEWPD